MLGLLLHEFAATESRLRVDKFIRAECSATFLALVTICTVSTAAWTCTCDVTVSKECLAFLVIVLLADLLDELALIVELAEIVRSVLVMGLRRCS